MAIPSPEAEILFRDRGSGALVSLRPTFDPEAPFSATIADETDRHLFPHVIADINDSEIEGPYKLTILERVKNTAAEHKGTVAFTAAATISGVALAVLAIKRHKK